MLGNLPEPDGVWEESTKSSAWPASSLLALQSGSKELLQLLSSPQEKAQEPDKLVTAKRPKLTRNTYATTASKDFLTHSPISMLGCHSSQLVTYKKHPEISICVICQPKSQCTSCNKQMGKGRIYLGKHFGIKDNSVSLELLYFNV